MAGLAVNDYHAIQMTGSRCQSFNCAAATGAMDVYFGTRGAVEMTADSFRNASGASCVPGKDTPSGGLSIPAIERTCAKAGVDIEFGRASSSFYRRWNTTELRSRLGTYWFGHILGDYDQVKAPWRAKGSTFGGDHSIGAHDLRNDLPDSHYGVVQETVCWHDPLRARPIRVPFSVLQAFNQKPNSAIRGFAGWVRIPILPGWRYAAPMTDRTRTRYATTAVHDERTTGSASTVRVIRGEGRLLEVAMYAPGESYKGSNQWGAPSLLGNEWVHVKRLDHVGGTT